MGNYNKKPLDLSSEEMDALYSILQHCEEDDKSARLTDVRDAKLLDNYWHGLQHLFWDSVTNEWKIPTHQEVRDVVGDDDYVYDLVINIFKAHGESIIAALSSDLPFTQFCPQNANDALDIRTTKAATKLSKVIQDHNDSKLLFLEALFTLYTSHFVACENYYERDFKYGQAQIDDYKNVKRKVGEDSYECVDCEYEFDEYSESCPNCASENIKTNEAPMEDRKSVV